MPRHAEPDHAWRGDVAVSWGEFHVRVGTGLFTRRSPVTLALLHRDASSCRGAVWGGWRATVSAGRQIAGTCAVCAPTAGSSANRSRVAAQSRAFRDVHRQAVPSRHSEDFDALALNFRAPARAQSPKIRPDGGGGGASGKNSARSSATRCHFTVSHHICTAGFNVLWPRAGSAVQGALTRGSKIYRTRAGARRRFGLQSRSSWPDPGKIPVGPRRQTVAAVFSRCAPLGFDVPTVPTFAGRVPIESMALGTADAWRSRKAAAPSVERTTGGGWRLEQLTQ